MKKKIAFLLALVLCLSLAAPAVQAEETEPAVPPEEVISQETMPTEEELVPATIDSQIDTI